MSQNKEKLEFDSLKNVETVDEIDLSKLVLQRGVTPEDITEKCLKLCKDYLSGDWTQQTTDTILVKRVSGGMTNQLYHCAINKPNPTSITPQEVAIRLYGKKYWNATGYEGNERFPDTIVTGMVSQNKIGPHVYGLFVGGQILKYYKHRQFVKDDQSNDKVVRQVFTKLAQIHAMDVPVKRGFRGFRFQYIDEKYDKFFNSPELRKELQEYKCETLLNIDIKAEIDWCRDLVINSGSPIVFTHQDFRSSNILITEPNEELVICDFESCCYDFRGQDFVNMYREWGREQFDFNIDEVELPTIETFGPLIKIYVEESERIFGKEWSQNPINSVEHIFNEIIILNLHSFFFGIMFIVSNDPDNDNGFPMPRKLGLEWAERDFKDYLSIKHKLIHQNII